MPSNHLIFYLCLSLPTKSRSSRWKSWASVVHHSQGLALGLELRWHLRLDAPAAESEVGILVQVSLEGGLPGEREGGKEGARPQLEASFSLIPGVGYIKVCSGLLLCILVLFLGLSSPQGWDLHSFWAKPRLLCWEQVFNTLTGALGKKCNSAGCLCFSFLLSCRMFSACSWLLLLLFFPWMLLGF